MEGKIPSEGEGSCLFAPPLATALSVTNDNDYKYSVVDYKGQINEDYISTFTGIFTSIHLFMGYKQYTSNANDLLFILLIKTIIESDIS